MDQKDMKIAALKEEISNSASAYAEKVADLRINITMLSQRLEAAQQQVADLQNQASQQQNAGDEEVVDGELLDG